MLSLKHNPYHCAERFIIESIRLTGHKNLTTKSDRHYYLDGKLVARQTTLDFYYEGKNEQR